MPNRPTRYYEARGELKKKLLDFQARRTAAFKAMADFSIAQGGGREIVISNMAFGVKFGVTKRPQPNGSGRHPLNDDAIWKPWGPNGYIPRASTKAGKAIRAAMDKLQEACPHGNELAKLIGGPKVDIFFEDDRGLVWATPGIEVHGKRVLVSYSNPKFKSPADLKRISDIEYEKITAAKRKRKVA
jgi:hypothetical protein